MVGSKTETGGSGSSYISEQKMAIRERNEFLKRFNRRSFLNYVEKHVDFRQEEIPLGKIEQVIVNFFSVFIFKNRKDFIYLPEFGAAIFELLHKHETKLPAFAFLFNADDESGASLEVQTKFLTLAYPQFNMQLGLDYNMFSFSVYLTHEMKKISNKLLRKVRALEAKAREKYDR